MFVKVNQSESATVDEFGTNQGVRNTFKVDEYFYYWINEEDKLDADGEVYIPAFTPSSDAVYEEVGASTFKELLLAARLDIADDAHSRNLFFSETGLTDE
jgi:hypothetical protein